MPQSKCKRNQRKTLHTHAKKKKNPGKIHPRKKKSRLSELQDFGFSPCLCVPKVKHSTKMGIIRTCPFLSKNSN